MLTKCYHILNGVTKTGKWTTIQYRNFNDFKFGSFTVYSTEKETVVRGILKKTNQPSLYQLTRRCNV